MRSALYRVDPTRAFQTTEQKCKMAYPGYGAPPPGHGAPPPGSNAAPNQDPLYGYFQAVAGQDNQIDASELQRCLTSSGISSSYKPFNKETCTLMINMLDRDYSGKMGFSEFKELWAALNQWKTTFMQYDRDRSGTVEPHELQQALTSFGYNLSPQAMGVMLRRYSIDGKVSYDNFIALCIRIRSLTTHFERRDVQRNGTAVFRYDDFIQVALSS